jgi:hypothetical protein
VLVLTTHALQASGAAGGPTTEPARPPMHACDLPAPASAADYPAALNRLAGADWGAADLSVSVPMPGGRSVWLYADTMSGPDSAHLTGFVHSTAIVQDAGCFHVVDHGRQLLPDIGAHRFGWPAGAVALDAGHILVSVATIELTGSCPFCFKQVGIRGAVLTVTADGEVAFARWTPSWPAWDGIAWGTGLARDGDRVVMYGLSSSGMARDLYVATSTVVDARAGRWQQVPGPVAHGVDPGGVAAYHDAHGWHVLTLRGGTLYRLDAATPAGPFAETATATTPGPAPTSTHLYYAAAAHPEQRLADGRLLVTVCQTWLDRAPHPLSDFRPLYLTAAR